MGKPMGEGFAIDCGRKNKEFSTPFGAIFGIKNAIELNLWRAGKIEF